MIRRSPTMVGFLGGCEQAIGVTLKLIKIAPSKSRRDPLLIRQAALFFVVLTLRPPGIDKDRDAARLDKRFEDGRERGDQFEQGRHGRSVALSGFVVENSTMLLDTMHDVAKVWP